MLTKRKRRAQNNECTTQRSMLEMTVVAQTSCLRTEATSRVNYSVVRSHCSQGHWSVPLPEVTTQVEITVQCQC